MSTHERDPIFESLDRLAGLADADLVGDRMPDIRRRVRANRRRRAVGAVAAAAVLAAGGLGLSQALPDQRSAPPVTERGGTPWQQIDIEAVPDDAGQVVIRYFVTGESTGYVDAETGEASDYTGPAATEVRFDGRVVARSEQDGLACDPDGVLKASTTEFHGDEPLVVNDVTGGEHTILVEASYCAGGELVESTETRVVTTEDSSLVTFDELDADLDGDGTDETVQVQVYESGTAPAQLLRVDWGTGETTSAPLLGTMERSPLEPVDLDGDGDLEVVVFGGGGETSEWNVFQAAPDTMDEVRTVDAAGGSASLSSDGGPGGWQTHLGADGFVSYRLEDPTTTQFPAPVEVRAWSLSGSTFTRSAESTSQCVTFQPTFVLGPC
ncbi:hypothetical protein [Nocardioides donggukensis]|uniref:Uncharacterized protein n=1 Tax=Nocardioides donggukensis TaxID=2774019 RepID=A0A927K499_9ACTN|nr:hypothetical protein [Nocardioides donggukensis]MBD8870189.1 hypothetical protein [Nocardioides donggukensis]